jgi:hypothetical protein
LLANGAKTANEGLRGFWRCSAEWTADQRSLRLLSKRGASKKTAGLIQTRMESYNVTFSVDISAKWTYEDERIGVKQKVSYGWEM